MAGRTLQNILIDVNAFADLSAELPTGDELLTRVNYANQAVFEAGDTGALPEFSTRYVVNPGTLASVSLPSGFRELESTPRQLISAGRWDEFPQIPAREIYSQDAGDKYCYILGNPLAGYTAVFTNLTANATLSFDYQRYPSGMATLSDMCELTDAQYVVTKVESYILQSRSDERFPQVEAEAQRRLQNMFGRSYEKSRGTINETRKRSTAGYNLGYQD